MQMPAPNQQHQQWHQTRHPNLTTTGNHLIFDFDTWCYDIAFAAEPKGGELRPFLYCTQLIDSRFQTIMARLSGLTYSGYLTGKNNFRTSVAVTDPYKGNRNSPKPHWYSAIRQYLIQTYNAVVIDGMEADDACAIEGFKNPRAIIVSRDKDLLQCMNVVYVYPCGKQQEFLREWVQGFICAAHFFHQVLQGDTTDNYKGLPGIGPAKSMQIFNGAIFPRDFWFRTLMAYASAYPTDWPDKYLEQATLAWMVRELDQDQKPITPELNGEFYERYYGTRTRPATPTF